MPPKNASITLTDADGLASFTDAAMLVLYLSREEVESGNVASALERLHIIADTRESAMRYRESLVFIVCGYDEDPRELAEIPQVRAFFARLVQEWPHWLWFLSRGVGAVGLFMSLLCRVKIHRFDKVYADAVRVRFTKWTGLLSLAEFGVYTPYGQ